MRIRVLSYQYTEPGFHLTPSCKTTKHSRHVQQSKTRFHCALQAHSFPLPLNESPEQGIHLPVSVLHGGHEGIAASPPPHDLLRTFHGLGFKPAFTYSNSQKCLFSLQCGSIPFSDGR